MLGKEMSITCHSVICTQKTNLFVRTVGVVSVPVSARPLRVSSLLLWSTE